jgi:hypothetical protein
MKYYKFGNVKCASGQVKNFECNAESFRAAKKLLLEFIENN